MGCRKQWTVFFSFFLFCFGIGQRVVAQVVPAASKEGLRPTLASIFINAGDKDHDGELSAYSSYVRTNTEFLGSNTAAMAGAALTFKPRFGLDPNVEIRGFYPVSTSSGSASESGLLGGLSLDRHFGHFRPYGDFLYGWGRITYPGSYEYNDYVYLYTSSSIYSPGGGVDFHLFGRWSLKGDFQYQHWNVPVIDAGHVWQPSTSIGISYRILDSVEKRVARARRDDSHVDGSMGASNR
jgi:hypothetical protein